MEDLNDLSVILNKNSIDYYKYDLSINNFVSDIIQEALDNNNKFAFPCISIFLNFLPLFSGKINKKSPNIKKLFEKDQNDLTLDENLEIENYFNDLFVVEKKNNKDFIYRFFSSNMDISTTLESNIDKFTLSKYITKVFGSEGMRHFLAIIQCLDQSGRQKEFETSINEHLEKLGYKREKTGSFNSRTKLIASNILRVLGSLQIEEIEYKNGKYIYNLKKLFSISGKDIDLTSNKIIIDGKFKIIVEDWWFEKSFNKEDPKYSKILKEIIFEDHKTHPITISLVPILSIMWAEKKVFKIKYIDLMKLCNLENTNQNIKFLKIELDYMKYRGYIKDFKIEEDNIDILSPNWFNNSIQNIKDNQDNITSQKKNYSKWDQIEDNIMKLGLSIDDLAKLLNVSSRTVYYIKSGKKTISKKMSDNLNLIFDK